jgi:hypothetical protein
MFALPGVRGILPGNTSRELFAATAALRPFITREPMADGVLAGLKYFGVIETAAQNAVSPQLDTARSH